MKNYLFAVCFLMSIITNCLAQPAAAVRGVSNRFSAVRDFSANTQIDFQLPSIKLDRMKGMVYYRTPDRYKVKLEGVAFLPKQNPFNLYKMIQDSSNYMAVSNGYENYRGKSCRRVQVIPVNDPEVVIAKLWIDDQVQCILKTEITGRSTGTVSADYRYGTFARYGLPDQIEFTVDMKTFSLPKMISVDLNNAKKTPAAGKSTIGKINFYFTDYNLNKGVTDAQLR